ncbi:hypothetical protein BBJ28_00021977 [Nothophytophthora sp. Chile5]|nr:hypothetical protein BBJ28_00021977 [Nothophytophthora sp. Chile5]
MEDPSKKPQKSMDVGEVDGLEKPVVTAAPEERDTFTLFVGPRGAGKSSLTAAFRNSTKAEEIKPTTALDYVFVRLRANGRSAVAHMWELASTKCVNEMIKVPLASERILNGALVIVLDLSTPGDVVPALVKWLATLYAVVHEVLKAKEKNPVEKLAVGALKQEAMARYGTAHPDKDEVTPLPLPLLIVGNKYETFREEDSVKRKGVTQAVRYLAHMYGANVLFTSTKDKVLVTQFRSVMKGFAFCAMPRGASKEVDPAKALFVPAGADLFEDIGVPKSAGWRQDRFSKDQHEEKARQWIKIASEYYPPTGAVDEGSSQREMEERDGKEGEEETPNQFPEPSIDRARQQKRKKHKKMDSVFGIVGKDFVLLAADCKVVRSILVYKDDEDKSINLDDHKVMVASGPQSDRLAFGEYIQKNMKLYELRNGVTLNGAATANYVRGELARFLRKAPYQVNLLVGAVDAAPETPVEPSLHWIDYLGAMVKVNFGAHGYGSNFCLSIFDREWKPELELDEAKKILKMCRAELDMRFLVRNGQWAYKVRITGSLGVL